MQVAEITLSSILTDVSSVFQAMIGFVTSICTTIVSNPLLLLGFCIPFCFAIIKLVKRLF